jgi:hypothetical protein
MVRSTVAFLAGLVAWALIATLINFVLRMTLDGYTAAEPALTFTLGMMVARLLMAAVTSVAAGALVGAITRSGTRVAWVLGAVILALFIPSHVRLWSHFPLWYHLAFLVPLVPLIVLGSWLTRARTPGKVARGAGNAGHAMNQHGS